VTPEDAMDAVWAFGVATLIVLGVSAAAFALAIGTHAGCP